MRRMIPTRMIDWIKDLEEVVKGNGANIEILGNLIPSRKIQFINEDDEVCFFNVITSTIVDENEVYTYTSGLGYFSNSGFNGVGLYTMCTYKNTPKYDIYFFQLTELYGAVSAVLNISNGVGDLRISPILDEENYTDFIPTYVHSTLISGSSGSLAFNINSFGRSPMTSIDELYNNVVKNKKSAVSGVYGASNSPIYYIDWGASIDQATINGTSTTLVSAIGDSPTITDNVVEWQQV